jgi:predicted DNA-binding transcriptional regulator AlpA
VIDQAVLEAIANAAERLAAACREAVRTSENRLADSRAPEQLSPAMGPQVHRSYLTAQALAELLDCDVRTLRRWVHEGLVPAPIQIGVSAKRWDPDVVEAWLQTRQDTASGNGRGRSR